MPVIRVIQFYFYDVITLIPESFQGAKSESSRKSERYDANILKDGVRVLCRVKKDHMEQKGDRLTLLWSSFFWGKISTVWILLRNFTVGSSFNQLSGFVFCCETIHHNLIDELQWIFCMFILKFYLFFFVLNAFSTLKLFTA